MARRKGDQWVFWLIFLIVGNVFTWSSLLYLKHKKETLGISFPSACGSWWILPDISCQFNNLVWIISGIVFLLSVLIVYGFTGKFTQNASVRWVFAILLSLLVGFLVLSYFWWGVLLFIIYLILMAILKAPPVGMAYSAIKR